MSNCHTKGSKLKMKDLVLKCPFDVVSDLETKFCEWWLVGLAVQKSRPSMPVSHHTTSDLSMEHMSSLHLAPALTLWCFAHTIPLITTHKTRFLNTQGKFAAGSKVLSQQNQNQSNRAFQNKILNKLTGGFCFDPFWYSGQNIWAKPVPLKSMYRHIHIMLCQKYSCSKSNFIKHLSKACWL